jgi:hypothetical protein
MKSFKGFGWRVKAWGLIRDYLSNDCYLMFLIKEVLLWIIYEIMDFY